MRLPIRLLAPALLAAGPLLTGCGGPEPLPEAAPAPRPTSARPSALAPSTDAPSTARPSSAGPSGPAVAAASLGGPGTACPLPVSFSLPKDWKPNAIELPTDPELADLADLARRGPAVMRCEIDAKPAGLIGFLRVWTLEKGSAQPSARAALEAFVKGDETSSAVTYREIEAGALPAVEATYTVRSALFDEDKEERAFAVTTPKGVVVVDLGGTDTEEHREMLPAYELARTTLKAL
ncbi:lipoprotein [Streptomyces cinereoruber]|uniref:lipoprotein n=1 Tax=Streptomyces cinereoruber TaxID=67260 RepID=UPI00362ECECA